MRMRTYIKPVAGAEFGRAEMIEEDIRSDHAAARMRQCAAHAESADVDAARHDHLFDCFAGRLIAGNRVLAGEEAHVGLAAPAYTCAGQDNGTTPRSSENNVAEKQVETLPVCCWLSRCEGDRARVRAYGHPVEWSPISRR